MTETANTVCALCFDTFKTEATLKRHCEKYHQKELWNL
jgi:hypothetical protein